MNIVNYYDIFDYKHYKIDKNKEYNLCFYCPAFNRILFVYDDYDVLKKLKLILSSKIRFEILNISNCSNFNSLNNTNCINYELKFIKTFGLTYSTYQRSETDFILNYVEATDNNIINIRDYLFFCYYITSEFYFHRTKYGMKYNYEELVLTKEFYKNVLNDDKSINFFNDKIQLLKQQLYFYNKIENILFFNSNENDCLKVIKKFIGDNFDHIMKNHHIELLVMDSYLRRNIKDD